MDTDNYLRLIGRIQQAMTVEELDDIAADLERNHADDPQTPDLARMIRMYRFSIVASRPGRDE